MKTLRQPARPLFFLVAAFAIVLAQSASAEIIDIDKDIRINKKIVGHLTLDHLGAYIDGNIGGAELTGNFLKTNDSLLGTARWVQIVNTTHPINTPVIPYFDPGQNDPTADHEPFYWNTPLIANDGNEHPEFWWETYARRDGEGNVVGINYYDKPGRTLQDGVHWEAELNLVMTLPGNKIAVLWSGLWGFDIAETKTAFEVTAFGVTKLAAPEYFTQTFLDSFNTFWDRKWEIVPAKEAIPAPGSLALVILASIVPVSRRRRAL